MIGADHLHRCHEIAPTHAPVKRQTVALFSSASVRSPLRFDPEAARSGLPASRAISGLRLCLFWRGDGSYLLHQAQGVEVHSALCDLASFDTVDRDHRERHLMAARRDAHKLAFLGAVHRPTAHDLSPSAI